MNVDEQEEEKNVITNKNFPSSIKINYAVIGH